MIYDCLVELFSSDVPEYLVKLFEIEEKSELKKYCRDIIIRQDDLVKLIANSHRIGYFHQIKYRDFVPAHLKPTDDEKAALGSATVGEQLSGKAETLINKVSQIFKERRYLVAHVFFNQAKWHLFYLDQKDIENKRRNHWKEGAHIHFVNYLWPQYDMEKLWEVFDKAAASAGGKLHIRYKGQE